MDRRVTSPTWGPPTPCKRALRMDKTNINALIQSIERSVHSIYKNRFSVKQQKFKQIWPEFQSIKCISLKNLSINTFWEVGSHEMVPLSMSRLTSPAAVVDEHTVAKFHVVLLTNSGQLSRGNWYGLAENRFFYTKCKERSIDCTSALMFVSSILTLSRNAIEK